MSSKNVLICLIAVLIGLITFLGGYLVAQKGNSGQTANISGLSRFNLNSSHPVSGKSVAPKLNRISTVKILSPAISETGDKIIYFEKESGKVLATDFSGENTSVLNGTAGKDTFSAVWSKDGYEALVLEASKNGLREAYLNFKNGQTKELDKNVSSAVWSKNNQKIAYLYFDSQKDEGNISLSNPDGSSFKNIFATRVGDLKLGWPKENFISFYSPGNNNGLFLLNIENGQLEKVLDLQADSTKDLQILWSPDGSRLLYSYQNNKGERSIKILDINQKEEFEIGLLTSANKCVWTLNSLNIYCGAKKDGNQPENLYQLDFSKKEFGLVFETSPTDLINIERPILSPTENLLIFANKTDSYLYTINLQN